MEQTVSTATPVLDTPTETLRVAEEVFGDPAASVDAGQYAFNFRVDIEGFEGPIDLLLHLARQQKVDLKHISILHLVDQYLAFITDLRTQNLEKVADYLVMAAWLAYLKSKLLLPVEEVAEDEPSPEEIQARLTAQLQRLQIIQKNAVRLMAFPRLGEQVFDRGYAAKDQGIRENLRVTFDVSLFDVLGAYGAIKRRQSARNFRIPASSLYSVEDSIARLRRVFSVQMVPEWVEMFHFLPSKFKSVLAHRSALASTFVATLDMVRNGEIEINQPVQFGPLYLRTPQRASA